MRPNQASLTIERYDYRAGLLFSVLVHLALLYIIQQRPPPIATQDQVINVVLEPPPETHRVEVAEVKPQIVTPPDNAISSEPVETRLLSERDSSTKREQIKRGDHPEAEASRSNRASQQPPKSVEPPRSKQEQPPPQQEKSPPSELKTLKLDQETLIERFAGNGAKSTQPSSSSSGYRAFSRPMGSGAAFIGLKGSTDFLPNLPDGDITLLNTKADRFAVFVRRVASQVFGQLRASGWENLSASDIARMSDDTTVTVIMGINGEIEAVKLEDGSGSTAFDRVVVEAARHGARDPNPPKEAAASDGKIHFTFQARSWVQGATNPRTGAPTERRWLLLATGLE